MEIEIEMEKEMRGKWWVSAGPQPKRKGRRKRREVLVGVKITREEREEKKKK